MDVNKQALELATAMGNKVSCTLISEVFEVIEMIIIYCKLTLQDRSFNHENKNNLFY